MKVKSELSYGTFEKTIYPYCADVSGIQEKIIDRFSTINEPVETMTMDFFDKYILLAAGLDDADVDRLLEGIVRDTGGVTSAMLSRYRNSQNRKSINAGIVSAYLKANVAERVEQHFGEYLMPTLVKGCETNVLYDLWQIIKADETIPQVYKDEFEILNTKETLVKFLSEVYVFSLTRYKNPRILKAVVEDEKRTKIHPMVQQVIRDIAIRGKSDMFVPVLDLLYLCISDDTEEYERIGLRYPDRRAFIEATGELRGTLDSEHALKYSRLLDTCYFHDLNEYRRMRDKGFDELLKKYGFTRDQVSSVEIGDNPTGVIMVDVSSGSHYKIDHIPVPKNKDNSNSD